MLSRPEYRENAPVLFQQVLNLLAEGLGRVLEAILGAGTQGVVGTVVVLVLSVVLVVLVVRLLAGVRRDPGADPGLSDAPGRRPQEWQAEAEEHERAGRWREALRCRYRLLLARLAERGLVDEVPGRTSGEYLVEARAALPAAAEDLRAVTLAFDRVWYGNRPADAEEVRRVREAVERIEAVARRDRARDLASTSAGASAGDGGGGGS